MYLRVSNHELEVIVAINACAQILVIVLKLLNRDNAISLMGLPNGHEVSQHFISCLATALEIRMEADIISNSNVINGHLATAILVKNSVCLMNHIKTACVERATNSAQKFIERQLTIFVCIEMLDNLSHFDL